MQLVAIHEGSGQTMLPDFPEVRRRGLEALHELLETEIRRELGVIGTMKAYHVPEGSRAVLRRSDGTTDRPPLRSLRTPVKVSRADIEQRGFAAIIDMMRAAAKDVAAKQARIFFERFEQVTEEAGQHIDMKGEPLTMAALLKGLERLDIEFDVQGNPLLPTMILGTKAAEKLAQLKVGEKEEEQFREFIERKRADFRDRESDRKLVG